MSNKISLNTFRPSPQDSFLFDNNIWMYIYYPTGGKFLRAETAYSALLGNLLNLKCNIFVNSMVLSEFINTALRVDHRHWRDAELKNGNSNVDFKADFMKSPAYKTSIGIIRPLVDKIIAICQDSSDDYPALDKPRILNELPNRDFNDNYYLALAERRKCKIVSHDGDMLNAPFNVDIITALP